MGAVIADFLQMGLHRDGHTWNLDEREVDKRRRLFWDIHTSDIFMVSLSQIMGCAFTDDL